jgi:hypothetical protein
MKIDEPIPRERGAKSFTKNDEVFIYFLFLKHFSF